MSAEPGRDFLIVLLVGPPAAGKDTQASMLAEEFNLWPLSIGAILRERAPEHIKEKMKKGLLIKGEEFNNIILSFVDENAEKMRQKRGIIITGFPRKISDIHLLDDIKKRFPGAKVIAIFLDVPQEEIKKRITGRYHCPKCGRVYNIYVAPPKKDLTCDYDGAKLEKRADDLDESAINKRLEGYYKEEVPIINSLHHHVDKFIELSGLGTVEDIKMRIKTAFERALKGLGF